MHNGVGSEVAIVLLAVRRVRGGDSSTGERRRRVETSSGEPNDVLEQVVTLERRVRFDPLEP